MSASARAVIYQEKIIMSKQPLSDQLWNGLGDAITDIRQKVVEEPLYGRAVTEGQPCLQWPEGKEQGPSLGSHTREIEPQQDLDLDR
jgi:hypothetical protein